MSTLLNDFQRDGYAIVRGLVSAPEIAEMAAAFERLLALARSLPESGSKNGSLFVVDPEPFRLHRVVWCGAAEPALAPYGQDPRFLAIAAELLGSTQLVQLIQQAHYKMPGDDVGFAWHQDASNRRFGTDLWTDVNGRGSFLQIALAIDPMRSDNGPLRVIPGTHELGFVAEPGTGVIPPEHLDLSRAVDVELEPGDLVVFGPFLLHGSPPNHSSSPRRLFLQGYTLPGANRRVYPGCGTGTARQAEPSS